MKGQIGRITKIKAKEGMWTFAWEMYQEKTRNWDKHTLVCKDMPRVELEKSLQVMANHVTEICEFDQSATKRIAVGGVSISYTDDNRYLVITALKDLTNSKGPLVINTPVRPELPENDCEAANCMSDELVNDLRILEEEAWKYIIGDRAQQSLDFGEPEKEKEKPEGGEKPTRAA